jgi:hypothetical protein
MELEGRKPEAVRNADAVQDSVGIDEEVAVRSFATLQVDRIADIETRHALMPVEPSEEFRPDLIEFTVDGGGAALDHAGVAAEVQEGVLVCGDGLPK